MPDLPLGISPAAYRTPESISGQSFCVWNAQGTDSRRPVCGLG